MLPNKLDHFIKEKLGIKAVSYTHLEDNATLFDIAQNALDETLRAKTKLYVLYDKVGKLTLQDIESMKLGQRQGRTGYFQRTGR